MTAAPEMLDFQGGPMHGESVALDDSQEYFVYALPTPQCNGAQEWAAYFRRDGSMIVGGRAYTQELALEQARDAKACRRPKAKPKLRGGT